MLVILDKTAASKLYNSKIHQGILRTVLVVFPA